jgi:hypothetical protein
MALTSVFCSQILDPVIFRYTEGFEYSLKASTHCPLEGGRDGVSEMKGGEKICLASFGGEGGEEIIRLREGEDLLNVTQPLLERHPAPCHSLVSGTIGGACKGTAAASECLWTLCSSLLSQLRTPQEAVGWGCGASRLPEFFSQFPHSQGGESAPGVALSLSSVGFLGLMDKVPLP